MKKILFYFIVFFNAYEVSSQSIGYLDLPVAGEQWIEFKDTVGSNITITAAGVGQVWNYQNNFTVHDTVQLLFQNPSTAPANIAGLFPQASLVDAGEAPGDYSFYKIDFTGLYLDGYYSASGIDIAGNLVNEIDYTNNRLIIPVPFQMGDVIQNTDSFMYVFPDPTLYPGALVRYTHSTFYDFETDAQGELTTPLGNYSSVIRIKEMITENFLYEIDSFAVGNFSYFTDITLPTRYAYKWLKNGPNSLVMTADLDEFNTVVAASYYSSGGLVADQESTGLSSLQVSPNPVSKGNNLTVKVNNDNAQSIAIFDLSGREIDQFSVTTKGASIQVNVSNYEAGAYIIKVTGKEGVVGMSRFVVVQ